MRCAVCDILLDLEDNYCRSCGAAVQVTSVAAVSTGAQPPALLRASAAPIATGAIAVAATALLRWAVGQAVRGIMNDALTRREANGNGRGLSRRDHSSMPALNRGESIEILWYRRSGRN